MKLKRDLLVNDKGTKQGRASMSIRPDGAVSILLTYPDGVERERLRAIRLGKKLMKRLQRRRWKEKSRAAKAKASAIKAKAKRSR